MTTSIFVTGFSNFLTFASRDNLRSSALIRYSESMLIGARPVLMIPSLFFGGDL